MHLLLLQLSWAQGAPLLIEQNRLKPVLGRDCRASRVMLSWRLP